MAKITLENARLSIVYRDRAYQFGFIQSVQINNPRENHLSGSPQGVGDGLDYSTNLSAPVTLVGVVRDIPAALLIVIKAAFRTRERVDLMLFDEQGGDEYRLGRALIQNDISNLNLVEGETAFDVPINCQCVQRNYEHRRHDDA